METPEVMPKKTGWRTVAKETPPLISTPMPASFETPAYSSLDPRSAVDRYKREIQKQLVTTIDSGKLRNFPLDRQRVELRGLLAKQFAADPPPVPPAEYDRVLSELLDDILGLGPLEPLLLDPNITDILVNGAHEVYVERRGVLELTDVRFRDDDHVLHGVTPRGSPGRTRPEW